MNNEDFKLLLESCEQMSEMVRVEKLEKRVKAFTGKDEPVYECQHKHKLQGTGAIFYQSVGLLQCGLCGGWQEIRKGIK